ncbi:MAG TPA: P1 family peptidase [Clostridia bacterium]|nr:P1 family peptidase [Clostridia bacterium]
MKKNSIREYGISIGQLAPGKNNTITDVDGVLVGHSTIIEEGIRTGVTAILPHSGNLFKEKVVAACHVINGFGKTAGTLQIEELGNIETPIVLTNTLSVGTAYEALVEYMLEQNEDIGISTGTVNPIVCECNDGYLNDIRGLHVKKRHVFESLRSASQYFEEGAVGAGTGMSCFGLKGGIGSSSRMIKLDDKGYTIGVLVLSNFGVKEDLMLDGVKAGNTIWRKGLAKEEDKGSVIVIIATDVPLSDRQLKRVSKRAAVGLSRLGSFLGNGSGDVVVSFSTANRINHYEERDIIDIKLINEEKINLLFRAAAEATEEAVLNSMVACDAAEGRDGNGRDTLKKYIEIIK